MTLQKLDDLVAHRTILIGITAAISEEQLTCSAQSRFELRMREEGFPVSLVAISAPKHMWRVVPLEG